MRNRARRRVRRIVVGIALCVSVGSTAGAGLAYTGGPTSVNVQRACAVAPPGQLACFALRVVPTSGVSPGATPGAAAATPSGYGPSDLQSAYSLPSATAGAGRLVAIVDAYDDPNAASDLAAYRSQFGLPPCTTANGCFQKVNQTGGTTPPAANSGWAEEESLDLDMVSAACPNCRILLVEASSPTTANLGTAVNTAVAKGAVAVSNSYGGAESSSDPSSDASYYNHPGVAITVSSGDEGYEVEFPASSPHVIAVGGTALSRTTSNARGWTESVWSTSSSEGAGSGCSKYETKPSWQTDSGCTKRTVADVSAVADPATGVAVYDTYGGDPGWEVFGGTSVSSPLIASVFAMATPPNGGDYPAKYLYADPTGLWDVTTGQTSTCGTYLCKAQAGYDGPTGLGTPNGIAAFGPASTTSDFSISVSPSSGSAAVGGSTSATVSTAVTSGNSQAVSFAASGLPSGASASFSPASVTAGSSSTMTISTSSSTPAGTYGVTVTGTGSTATHSATFTLTVTAGAPANDFSISVSPTSGSAVAGSSASATVSTAVTSGNSQAVSFAAGGLPSGASASFSPASVTAGSSSTMTISTSSATPAGTYTVTITGTASSGSHTTTYTLTVTSASTCAAGQKLVNPGFESGSTGWTATAGVLGNSGVPTHSGSQAAWLDGYGRTHTDTLSQTVTIPAGCSSYTFSFWVYINTSETTSTTAYDKLTVTAGSTTLATYSNLNHSSGYVQKSFNLSSFAGQSVTLKFTGTEDSSLQTSFFIDDTAVTVS
ncbi:MAG TPA: hypothetical protein VFA30_07250 [Gaiellaceae bacterium]|nr:hypothetical protein [Gaiellaceae bacterium]